MCDSENSLKARLLAILADLPAEERLEIADALRRAAEEASRPEFSASSFPSHSGIERKFFLN
jgi:hypothetical protein